MIGALRIVAGALFGAALAGTALRARRVAEQRGESLAEVLPALPAVLREDAGRVRRAAESSVRDGKRAAREAELEIDKVLQEGRRKRGDA